MLSPTPAIDRSSLHPGAGFLIAPRVPHGLAAVVEGLTREVLRHRPEDIYVFAAHHFEKLLKLREQYHAEEYSGHEPFNHEFNRDFNLWPTKNAGSRDAEKYSNGGWSVEKEIRILEEHRKVLADAEDNVEDASTDTKEHRKVSRQAHSKARPTATKRTRSTDKETTLDARATKIMSQMPGLHGPSKNIQARDIKQELRKNKLSGEKGKTAEGADKAVRGERRSRTRISKSNQVPKEEVEHFSMMVTTTTTTMTTTTTTTTMSTTSKTSTRRPLKKVQRVESESEVETERETATKDRFENKSSIKSEDTIAHPAGSREKRPAVQLSEHSSGRKVSSRALSMDRIRAYVLRKFASTASLEVLRSPTYVEQVQEVIDRAVPIIKEKLEEIRQPRAKRSRSVDFGWNDDSFHQRTREGKRDEEEEESGGGRNGSVDSMEQEEAESSQRRNGTVLKRDERKQRKRSSIRSARRSRRRENGADLDKEVDRIGDSTRRDKSEPDESDEPRDTLEARLTATQNILEDISKSTSELGGTRRTEAGEPLAPEAIDHVVNVVSLPIVRPPSSKNSKNASKNGADSLTLPPISPEVPKSTKKKDELSLPILSAINGNYSTQVKSQEQDASKDVEEASTMRDLTSDLEDMAILPEDDQAIEDLDMEQDLIPDIRTFVNEEMDERDESINEALQRDAMDAEKVDELEELEGKGGRMEEVFKDSLNATPEVSDVPLRPDSLEPAEDEIKLEDENTARDNRFDGLKDKLLEIEMAERGIEKALAGQQIATCEGTSQAGMSVDRVDERERVSEKRSMDKAEISIDKEEEKRDHDKGDKIEDEISDKAESPSNGETEKSINVEEVKNKMESLTREANEMNKVEKSIDDRSEASTDAEGALNEVEKSANETDNGSTSETERTKNATEISGTQVREPNRAETSTRITEEVAGAGERKKSTDEDGRPTSDGESPRNDADELAIKDHVEDAQSVDTRSQDKEITEAVVSEIERDNEATESKSTADESSDAVAPEKDETSAEAEAPEADESATTSPLEISRTYVLNEGSPCEIPESVTTVIIPDRPCPSPVTPHENQSPQLGSARRRAESVVRSDEGNETREEGRGGEYGMEVFGEYVRAENNGLPGDVDLRRGVKAAKLPADMVHQDLDKIKEEGEEEAEEEAAAEEKEDPVEGGKVDGSQERGVEGQEGIEKWGKPIGTLENIMEHEESEETVVGTSGEVAAAEKPTYESLPDTAELTDVNVTDVGAVESTSTLDNSSEESGSTAQDNHRTTTSSERKESITSNRSIESSSLGRPVVPELNLDSLQDNTVSSFKMTANDTAKEDNSSPRGSDTTTSLIEPLTSDERLMNRSVPMDPGEEASIEQLNEDFSREPPDQLYQAEQVEYEWLEKDPLSLEIMSRGEAKSPRDGTDSTRADEDVGPLSREKEGEETVSSEEEIARELIGSLNATEMQLGAEEPGSKGESKEGSVKSDSTVDDDRSVPSTSVAELERKERQTSLDEWKELDNEIAEKTELDQSRSLDEFDHMAGQADKDENDIEIERSKSTEGKDETTLAPLAQFEQDESLERKSRPGTADEEIPVESEPMVADSSRFLESREKREDEETSVEEAPKSENEAGDLNDETNYDGSVVSEKEVKDAEEKIIEDRAAEGESVRESITSAISEQSLEDHPHGGYWTMGTKSSTVETVIETVSPALSVSDEVKADVSADVSSSEVIATESLSARKIDFYAAVKIQACIRGFLARRRVRKELSKFVSTQKIARDDYSMALEETPKETKTERRLQRGEALRSATLSLENAFASGRLQHTSEFHDCIPLPIFDATNSEFDSTASNEISSKEENVEQEPDVPRSGTNESDPNLSHNHDNEHARNFQKSTSFAHPSAFPVVMHLMTDPSRNFRINESYDPNFNPTAAAKSIQEQAILMLGLDPRDEDNGYLNFITSVEDLGSNANSLSLDDVLKLSRGAETAHRSATRDEDSIREPLALPGTPQGVVIEEVTSLEGTIPSPTTPKTSLDANSSLASEERGTAEDEKDDLGTSPATVDVRADWERVGVDGQKLRETIGGVGESEEADSHAKDDGSGPRNGRDEEGK